MKKTASGGFVKGLERRRALMLCVPLVIAACTSANREPAPSSTPSSGAQPGPQPQFGALVEQPDAPPPISGGTLAVSKTSGIAVAADPDRDRIYVVDLPNRVVLHDIALAKKSEPGRVALDHNSRAHVALRNAGQLATVDLTTGALSLRQVCATPRGVTYDATKDLVYVACATGELVTVPASGGDSTLIAKLGLDLRDVVLSNREIYATRFRSAEIIGVADGSATSQNPIGGNLAWRAISAPDPDREQSNDTAVVAQDPSPIPVNPEPGGYGGVDMGTSCQRVGIVSTRLFLLGDQAGSVRMPSAVLPVDLATNGREFVVVAAGNAHTKELPQIFVVHRDQLANQGSQECVQMVEGTVPGQAVAAGFDDRDELVVQTREPAALHIMSDDRRRPWKTIVLSTESKEDTGHAIFHSNAGGNIACASCHAEGADDGHVWEFVGMGPRRTPSLLGTTPGTEPFHWSGDMKDLSALVDHVFVERMSGPKIDKPQVDVLGKFIFTLPPPTKVRSADTVPARGRELFAQRCASCHSGSLMTNNRTIDVGTGGAFQVPSLVGVAWRGPFLHTGCASTLADRFNPACGGESHGDLTGLSGDDIADLVKVLESF